MLAVFGDFRNRPLAEGDILLTSGAFFILLAFFRAKISPQRFIDCNSLSRNRSLFKIQTVSSYLTGYWVRWASDPSPASSGCSTVHQSRSVHYGPVDIHSETNPHSSRPLPLHCLWFQSYLRLDSTNGDTWPAHNSHSGTHEKYRLTLERWGWIGGITDAEFFR